MTTGHGRRHHESPNKRWPAGEAHVAAVSSSAGAQASATGGVVTQTTSSTVTGETVRTIRSTITETGTETVTGANGQPSLYTTQAQGVITIVIEITQAQPTSTPISSSAANATGSTNSTLSGGNSTSFLNSSMLRTSTPLSFSTIPTTPIPTSVPLSNSTQNGQSANHSSRKNLSGGAIAGISVGAAVGVIALLALLALIFWRRRKAAERDEALDDMMAPSSRPDPFSGQQDMPGSSVRYSLDDEGQGMSEHRF
ncbi:hypothetical protein RQP46_002252 [Phenoliferia psychrophenolica]